MGEVVAGPWTWWTFAVTALAAAVLHAVIRKAQGWACTALLGAGRRAKLPPGDMGWPLVGNMWAFLRAFESGKPDDFIASYHRRFGRIGLYRAFMFSSPTILVTTPEACKKVLMDDVGFVPGWPKSTATLIGTKSFLGIRHEEHRRVRKLTATPINGLDALTTYLGFIDQTVVSTLARLSEGGKEVEFLTEVRRMTFKIIMQIFMSGADDRTMKTLEESYTDLNFGVRAMAIDLPGFVYHTALKARKKLVSVLQGILDERRAATAEKFGRSSMDMMDRLIQVKDEHGRMLEDDDIIDILIMYLNAGHESSGRITMWATVFVQENPEVLARAKAEQEEIMRSIPPTQKGLNLKDYRKMKYLSQVIDETLRIVNVGFMVFRQATRDMDVDGYLIPKGWKVQLWYRSVNMDPQIYSDPYKFNPSRWEGHPPRAGTFLPFGLGSRTCPGNDLAKLEISVFLHHFLLGYKLTRTNPNCRTIYLPHPKPMDNCLAKITNVSDGY